MAKPKRTPFYIRYPDKPEFVYGPSQSIERVRTSPNGPIRFAWAMPEFFWKLLKA